VTEALTDNYRIRVAAAADENALGTLWAQLMNEMRQLDPHQPMPIANAGRHYAGRVIRSLNDPHTRVFVAQHEHAVIGYALGALLDTSDLFAGGREGFIVDLYVLPTARRAGVGGALVAALREWFVEQGALQIVLNVDSANAAGRAFWQALGGSEYQIKMRIDLPDMPRASDGSGVGQMESKIP